MASQLTLDEREVVSPLIYAGESNLEIAEATRRHRTTVWRERQRNSDGDEYHAVSAQARTDQRRRERPLERKMDRQEVQQYVCEKLEQCWSPDQIGGRVREQFPDEPRRHVSHQTICVWINSRPPDERRRWKACLRRHGRTRPERDGRGRLSGVTSIAGRPKVVNERRRSRRRVRGVVCAETLASLELDLCLLTRICG